MYFFQKCFLGNSRQIKYNKSKKKKTMNKFMLKVIDPYNGDCCTLSFQDD